MTLPYRCLPPGAKRREDTRGRYAVIVHDLQRESWALLQARRNATEVVGKGPALHGDFAV